MNRRKFIKTSMCIGCGAAMLPASQSALITELSSKFSKDKFIYKRQEDLPRKLCIDACNLCQLNCAACWVREIEKDIAEHEGFGYLKFEDFKNLLDENPQLESIELSDTGEVFLNPELDKIIEYAYKKNVELSAWNGVNLNDLSEEMAEYLVKYKFKLLVASIDGATPETYKIYRVGGDYNKVIENIKKIQKYKRIYKSEYPELIWKFIVFGHNEHEIELAKEKAKSLDMSIWFSQNYVKDYSPLKNKELVTKQTGVSFAENFYTNKLKKNEWYFCYQLFESPMISWNGNLRGCCVLKDRNFGANVFKEGLLNALNSEQYVEAKHIVTDFSYKPKNKSHCKECYYYNNVLRKENICLSKFV